MFFLRANAALLIFLFLGAESTAAFAESANSHSELPADVAVVSQNPLVFEMVVGEEKTLDIVIQDAVDVYGAQVEGTFDPQAIDVVDANPGLIGIQMIAGNIPMPGLVNPNLADNTNGTFIYAITQINPQEPASGDGIIFSMKVKGVTIGLTSLTFTKLILADQDANPLPVSVQSGIIRVLPITGAIPVYLPVVFR